MMKTRRKGKAAAAAAAAAASPRETSPAPQATTSEPPSMTIVIPDDIDTGVLSNVLPDVPLTSPSPDSIVALYRWIVAQTTENQTIQRELEETRAEVERKEVELDQALQDRESTTADFEATIAGLQKELAQVKQEKDGLSASKAALEAQVSSLSNTQTASSTEVETLKNRVQDVEREKRDLIGVMSRIEDASAQREEEVQMLRSNLKQARQQHQEIESQLRELRSTDTSTKFKLESLTQQLALAKDEMERMSQELKSKSEEFAKYRRTKHAELAQLQASHDSLVQTHDATESTLNALQSAHTAQSHQLTQALARVQELTGRLAEQEASYSTEAANLRRLVDMMQSREEEAKTIVEGIQQEWAEVGDRADRREAVLRDKIESEMDRAEKAEQQVKELQTILNKVHSGDFPIPTASGFSTPSTPVRAAASPSIRGTPDLLMQGMMGLSPTVAMASRTQKSGKTFTEVYADYVRLQEDHAHLQDEAVRMEETINSILAQIQERAPVLAEQRSEYERMQSEVMQLSSQLQLNVEERENYRILAQENEQLLAKSVREKQLLEKHLGDLGLQVRALLRELGRIQNPSIPPDLELEVNVRPAESIDEVITNNLVLFRSIPQLQDRNQQLLVMIRELGQKLEAQEQAELDQRTDEQVQAVKEAHEAIKQLQEQLDALQRSSDMRIQAYKKECETLRDMLEKERGSAPLINTHADGRAQSELEKQLDETQNQFDTYRTEMGADSDRLREELIAAQRQAHHVVADLAKANAKIDFLNERHHMLQEQSAIRGSELDNLSKRNQQLHDQNMRIDIECNRVSEDLLAANAVVEQLRNERANLLAEKRIWESVQTRLVEENKALTMERSYLSDLMANVQKMHNDLERSGENDRQRLESRVQLLENQTQDLRAQLQQERDSSRHVTLQKDLDLKDMQTRTDKMTDEFSKTREALVSAETSKKHLEERVEQLTRQLQGDEEKLAVYERRASGVSTVAQHADQDISHEQALEAEVAELRSALKVAEVDLAAARKHVQQFQEISQANEAALASLNATHDEYKASMEAELARQKTAYDALEEHLKTVQEELARVSEKYTDLQRTFEAERAEWTNDKKTLEDTICDIAMSEKNSETDRATRENEVRQQEERTKAAEERYARELLAHAEAVQTVEDVKQQLAQVKAASRDNLRARDTAETKLLSSEVSWKQQKDALDKEVADLNSRCKDLATQNSLLHRHLESVSSQAARIRQAADASSAPLSGDVSADEDTKLSELRSVVTYLRKEKEIVDLQLELSKQETARLKAQIEHLTKSLEQTREDLSEERERAVETVASEAQHAELIERINQLAVLRESNATLRADSERHARRAAELDTKLKQMSAEFTPAKESLRVTQAELEVKSQQVQHLEVEVQKWRERNAQLLNKYDRIDPAEVQSLKDEIDRLKSQSDTAAGDRESELGELREKVAVLEAKNIRWKEIGKENNERFKAQMNRSKSDIERLTAEVADLHQQLETIATERDQLKSQIQAGTAVSSTDLELSKQVETFRSEKAALEKTLSDERSAHAQSSSTAMAELRASNAALQAERDQLLAEKATWSTIPATDSSEAAQQWASEKAELINARDLASAQVQTAVNQARKAVEDSKQMLAGNNNLRATIDNLEKLRAEDHERAVAAQESAVAAAVEKVKSELHATPAPTDEIVHRHAQELHELEQRLTWKHQAELRAAVATARQEALAGPHAISADQQQIVNRAIAAQEAKIKANYDEEIAAAVDRGRLEQAAKVKLKDSQLMKTQVRMKELEAKIKEWQDAGIISEDMVAPTPAKAAPAPAPDAASTAAPAPVASSSAHPPTSHTAPATVSPPHRSLPRKPSVAHVPLTETSPRGRGRNLPRPSAGISIRGAGRSGSEPPSPESAGGVSIMGASKRAREDGEAVPDDSLVKRMKPDGPSRPVQLRRDRVQPPP